MSKRVWARMIVVGLAGLLILSSGCRKSAKDTEEPLPRQTQAKEEPEVTEAAPSEKEDAPHLGLIINQLGEVDTYPGWPVLVELRIWHPRLYRQEAKAEPMTIASSGESWAEAVKLSVEAPNGKPNKIPMRFVPPKEGALTLDDQRTGGFHWWISGEDTAKLTEGNYRLVASLDTRGVGKPGIWQGRAESGPVVFHFKKEPSPLTEEQAEEKLLLLAACARDLGQNDKAKRYVDELLASQPESIQGLAFKGDQLEESGDKAGAMRTYEKAILIFHRKYPDAEPPRELYKTYNRLLFELRKK